MTEDPDRWIRRVERMEAWEALEATLPPFYSLLVQGPTREGTYSVGVVYRRTPPHQVLSVKGPLTDALRDAKDLLVGYIQTRNVGF